jgi:peptidoglycan/LPS O-acetylase OafA/YrhL
VSERARGDAWVRPALVAGLAGAVLWWLVAAATGRREAWDAPLYWAVAYPVALVVCAGLGYVHRDRPWRWALVLFQGQFLAMCLYGGEVGNLWPLGMALFAVLALPGMALARLAARARGS